MTSKSKDLLIYDGDCGICSVVAVFIYKKDIFERLEIKPYQELNFEQAAPLINIEQTRKSVYLIDRNKDRYYSGARAFFETLKRLPGMTGFIGSILANNVFSLLFTPLYFIIAKNRTFISRILGLKDCKI